MTPRERSLLLGFAIGGCLSPIILCVLTEFWGTRAGEIAIIAAIGALAVVVVLIVRQERQSG